MRIYTKTGDTGETSLFGGARVPKDDLRVECYGTVDELNACLGVVLASKVSVDTHALLSNLQSALFVVGAELACVPEKRDKLRLNLVGESDITSLEQAIDRFEAELPPLVTFVMPGGTLTAALLHQARTLCRRAERQVVALARESDVSKAVIIYLNRLSDLLFVLARSENVRTGIADVPWNPR